MQVLDAPMLGDDFYLSLIDWSSQNVLSVGLRSHAYLRAASTEQVTWLCNLSASGDSVTSVAWNERVSHNSITSFLCKAVNFISVISEHDYYLFC
jgi:cell division cycle 20-like protein 1 (cofactor of APC complex)